MKILMGNIIIYIMQEIKQILQDRIASILQLQCLFINKQKTDQQGIKKYDLILQHKKAERIRSMRENQILIALNNSVFPVQSIQKELYEVSMQILSLYDQNFSSDNYRQEQSFNQKTKKIYVEFFDKHGFRAKSVYINKFMEKDKGLCWGPALYLGWLAEWSKKIYCQLLQSEITKTFQMPKDRSPKSVTNSFTVGIIQSKSKKLQKVQIERQKFQGTPVELSEISLSNKVNIFSYFLDDLTSYYKLTGLQLDISFLKNIRKRPRKDQFLKSNNLTKAVNFIIQNPGNNQISVLVNSYHAQYTAKYGKIIRKQAPKLSIQPIKKVIFPFSPIRKKTRTNTETDEAGTTTNNVSKLLSPKLSQIQFMKADQAQSQFKRVKVLSHFKSTRNNLQFPGIACRKDAKYDLKWFIQERNSNKSTKLKQDIVVTLQKKLKQRDFLKCQSLQSKYQSKQQDQNSFQNMASSQNRPKRSSILPKYLSDYEDRRLKISKIFDLSDLRTTKSGKTQGFVFI